MDRTITVPEGLVAITVDDYEELLADRQTLIFLINGMMDKAHLSYSEDYLIFEDNAIKTLLMASEYAHRYKHKMQDLIEEKEE